MTLSFDIERCHGTTAPLCQTCRRREPGRAEGQTYVSPAWVTSGCLNYIAPEQTQTASTSNESG